MKLWPKIYFKLHQLKSSRITARDSSNDPFSVAIGRDRFREKCHDRPEGITSSPRGTETPFRLALASAARKEGRERRERKAVVRFVVISGEPEPTRLTVQSAPQQPWQPPVHDTQWPWPMLRTAWR